MAALYQILEMIENFDFQVDEETGELLNADELDQLEIDRDVKIENTAMLIKEWRAMCDAIKTEEESLKKRRESLARKADSLEGYLGTCLKGESFSTPKVDISWRKSERVNITDEDAIPSAYIIRRIVTEDKPDKAAIKKALRSGIEIPGAELEKRNNISVR